jgi:hypothetical protein
MTGGHKGTTFPRCRLWEVQPRTCLGSDWSSCQCASDRVNSTVEGSPSSPKNFSMRSLLPLVFALLCSPSLWADATLFVQEPYGFFGGINPTGHAAVYLSRVCAETPIVLRRCDTGESGIVISRYRRLAGYDWVAIPLVPYLYAVDELTNVPEEANSETVAYLRDEYRRKHLRTIVPDAPDGRTPKGLWVELVGAAYNRKIYGFHIDTTEAQDQYLISVLNSRENKGHFNLFFNNCADFSRGILNLYYSGAIRRSFVADAGITTPQQIAKSLIWYTTQHPELRLSAFFLPQIPGNRHPSRRVYGVSSGLVTSKKYFVPLAALHPWFAGGILAFYLAHGRFNVADYAWTKYAPIDLSMMQGSGVPRRNEVVHNRESQITAFSIGAEAVPDDGCANRSTALNLPIEEQPVTYAGYVLETFQ